MSNNNHPEDIFWKQFPQKKLNGSVRSLRDICMGSICHHFDQWMSYLPDDAHLCRNVTSPFNILSSNDTLEILELLLKNKTFQPNHLNLILHEKLTRMDFDYLLKVTDYKINKKSLQIYIKVMFRRCKRIKYLSIENFNISKVIRRRIGTYKNLEVLFLGEPNEEVMLKLSKYCNRLKMLHFQWSPLNAENLQSISNFSELQSLSIRCRRYANISPLWSILNGFSKLTSLVLDNCSLRYIEGITQCRDVLSNLTKLYFNNSFNVPYRVLMLILTKCLVNVVDLKLPTIEEEDMSCSEILDSVAALQFLRTLDLSTTYYELTGNFQSCLMKIGSRLKVLNLSSCSNVNLWIIRKNCENLEELYSMSNYFIIPERRDRSLKQNNCPKLRLFHIELFVSRIVRHNLSSDIELNNALKDMMFLDSPISNLKLSECNQEIFESILNEMESYHLERLEISRCMNVTMDHVIEILLKFVNLKYLSINHCLTSLTRDEKKQIEDFVKQSRIDVTVDILN